MPLVNRKCLNECCCYKTVSWITGRHMPLVNRKCLNECCCYKTVSWITGRQMPLVNRKCLNECCCYKTVSWITGRHMPLVNRKCFKCQMEKQENVFYLVLYHWQGDINKRSWPKWPCKIYLHICTVKTIRFKVWTEWYKEARHCVF